MAKPDNIKNTRVFDEISVIVLKDPTINTISHEKNSITIVLIAVAKFESVFFIPIFASIAVIPAKNAELFTGKNTNVYTIKTLEAKLSTDKYQADKGADIPAMKAALEKYTVK